MLIDPGSAPQDTVLYIAACALELLKHKSYNDIDELRADAMRQYEIEINYSSFILSLNFLFLIKKIIIKNNKVICI
jgi:hypothetical protein